MKNIKPKEAIIAVTYRCNSKCTYCSIWQKESKPKTELKPKDYKRLPRSLQEINITGGEPFLRRDLAEIIRVINKRCRYPKIAVSTNGYLTKPAIRVLSQLSARAKRHLRVVVSLDGRASAHNRLRGREDGFARAVKTIKAIQKTGVATTISFTIGPLNYSELYSVYRLARKLKVGFTETFIQSSALYFGQNNFALKATILQGSIDRLIKAYLGSWRPYNWARAYYLKHGLEILRAGRRLTPCLAGEAFFFMDPSGQIYPCNLLGVKMGHLEQSELICPGEVRAQVKSCRIPCWMTCTARRVLWQRPGQAIRWIIGQKIKTLPGFKPGPKQNYYAKS